MSFFTPTILSFAFVAISFFLPAQAGALTRYEKAEAAFQKAALPDLSLLQSGWHTGRCWTRSEPRKVKSGAFVLIPENIDGQTQWKQIIPASSLRSEADYFDEIDAEEYEIYKEELYEKSNPYAHVTEVSLVSDLFYGILIGTLHTRQSEKGLWVTMTNFEETPDKPQSAYFYCLFTQKVRDL